MLQDRMDPAKVDVIRSSFDEQELRAAVAGTDPAVIRRSMGLPLDRIRL